MNREKYQEGLLDVVQFLELELRELLKEEGRFKYRVERFWRTIDRVNRSVNDQVTLEDIDFYGRVLYLLQKPIHIEYKFLRKKLMTPADCAISIIHKILEISETLGEYRFIEQHREIEQIINTLWGNIHHKGKYSKLFKIEESILDMIKNEKRGTLSSESFSFDFPKQKEMTLTKEKYYSGSTEREIEL